MKPIINPIWFYFIEVFDNFRFVLVIIGTISFILADMAMLVLILEKKVYPKILKKIVTISIIAVCMGMLMPSKDTCYKMMVASYMTPNNIEMTKGNVTEIIDYIVDCIKEIANEN